MAISLQGSNLVWQKVRDALAGSSPQAQLAFKALKTYLATQGKNPQLQFIPTNGYTSASDGGNAAAEVLANAACKLYAIYLVKRGTTATWYKGSNHATVASTDGTQVITIHDANAVTGDNIVQTFSNGKDLSTGLTITQNTTATGSTLTLLANRFDGFVIIGAP